MHTNQVHVPVEGSSDVIAGLALHLEGAVAPQLMTTTLAVRSHGGVTAFVICHLVDGTRTPLSPTDARVLAIVLREDHGHLGQFAAWADSLDEAADTAERQAAAVLMGMGDTHEVTQPRGFREGAR